MTNSPIPFPQARASANAPNPASNAIPDIGDERSNNVGQWSRWFGGGVLPLAIAGLLVPTTASAAVCTGCNGEEVIEIEGSAPTPWNPDAYDGIGSGGSVGNPAAPNGTPGGDSAGGAGGGSSTGEGATVPSGGGSAAKATQKRIDDARDLCDMTPGTWDENVIFHDKGIETNKKLVGFRCESRFANPSGGLIYNTTYYDSRGFLNHTCTSTAEKTICTY